MKNNFWVKGVSLLLVIAMLLSGVGMASFAERHIDRDIKVWINDFYVMSDVYPFAKNGRTYVPVRFIAEELGYKVGYEQATKKVTLSGYGKEIIMHIGSSAAFLNGKSVDLGETVPAKDGRTFLPLRKIAEFLGQEVSYDANAKVAVIGSGYESGKFYHLKYYYRSENVYITDEQYDFLTLKVLLKDGSVRTCASEKEMFGVADDEVKGFFENSNLRYNKESSVPANKQLFDEYYVESDPNDPIVGTWYGKEYYEEMGEYMDTYMYVIKTDEHKNSFSTIYGDFEEIIGEYLVIRRVVEQKGSEFLCRCYAEGQPDDLKGEGGQSIRTMWLNISPSYETFYAVGGFDYTSHFKGGSYENYVEYAGNLSYFLLDLNEENWQNTLIKVNEDSTNEPFLVYEERYDKY